MERLDPWEKVGTDLFHWNGQEYVIIVDYKSNYPEMALLSSATSENVITHLKSVFARHGIPKVVVSDNGPQYASDCFVKFARQYGFEHRTSSPRYAQSNGKAEKGVGIVKRLLNKAKESGSDPYLALLAYRMAPKEGGLSPAELLMGRRIRGLVPEFKAKTKNEVSQTRDNDLRRNRQIERYNQHARDLPPLKVEDQVRVRDKIWDQPAKVTGQVGPRSYEVTTSEGGILRRNRKHLLKVKGDLEAQEVAAPEVHWESMERGVQAKSG